MAHYWAKAQVQAGHGFNFHNLGYWFPKWANALTSQKRSFFSVWFESAKIQNGKSISEKKDLIQMKNVKNGP